MSSAQLTVAVLFWTSAVVIGLDALKATGRKAVFLWVFTGAFVLAGFLVPALWNAFPNISGALVSIGTFAPTWFFLLGIAFLVLRDRGIDREMMPQTVASVYDDAGLRAEMASLQEITDSNSEILAAFARDAQGINKRSAAIEDINKSIVQDYQRMCGLETRFAGLTDGHKLVVQAQFDTVKSNFSNLQEQVTDLANNIEKAEANAKERYGRYNEALYAIYTRERLSGLANEIEFDVEQLYYRLNAGEKYDGHAWEQWENVHGHWEKTLRHWIDTSRWYARDVMNRILSVNDGEYDGSWTVKDDQFPTADAVRRFKRHRIIHSHWDNVRNDVEKGIIKVAYTGGSEKEQHGGQFHQS